MDDFQHNAWHFAPFPARHLEKLSYDRCIISIINVWEQPIQVTLETVLWAGCLGSFSVTAFFLKKTFDRVDKSITKEELAPLKKQVEALTELTHNINAMVTGEISALRTEIEWLKKKKLKKKRPLDSGAH